MRRWPALLIPLAAILSLHAVEGLVDLNIGFADAALQTAAGKVSDYKTTNFTLRFISLPKNSGSPNGAVDKVVTFEKLVADYKLSALIHYCSYDLLEASQKARVPYFLMNDASCAKWNSYPSTIFKIYSESGKRPPALKVALAVQRVREVMLVTDFSSGATDFFSYLKEENQIVAVVYPHYTKSQIKLSLLTVRQRLAKVAPQTTIVVLIDKKNQTFFNNILEVGLFSGLMTPKTEWFLPTYPWSISTLSQFLTTGGIIYTMEEVTDGIPKADLHTPTKLAKLAVRFIVSVYGPVLAKGGKDALTTLRAGKMKNGAAGTLGFNTKTGDALNQNVIIDLMKEHKIFKQKYTVPGAFSNVLIPNAKFVDGNDWKIAILPIPLIYSISKTTGKPTGFAWDMLTELKKINPTLITSFIQPEPGTWNETMDLPTAWKVLVDMLVKGRADVAFVPMAVTTDFYKQVDFSRPVFGEVSINMLMARQNQTIVQRMAWYFLVPFTFNVWFGCFVSFILLSFVLWTTDKISPNYGNTPNISVGDSLFIVISAFMMSKLDVRPRMMSVRIFNLLLYFATVIMMASYSAAIFGYLLKKPAYIPVKDFQSALGYQGQYQWFFRDNDFSLQYFKKMAKTSPQSTAGQMYILANHSWPKQMVMTDRHDVPATLRSTQKISIGDSMTHKIMEINNCDLMTQGGPVRLHNTAFPMRWKWKGRELFLAAYNKLVKTTTLQQMKTRYFEFNSCLRLKQVTGMVASLDVFDLAGLFIILAIGVLLGIVVCVIEFIVYKADLSCQRLTGGGLKFGNSYSMKVVLLEPDGIWAEIPGKKRQYFVSAANLHPNREHDISPADLGMQVGTKVKLLYNGNDPKTGERLFRRAC